MDPARVNTSESDSVIVDPISQVPDPIVESRRFEKPRRKRAIESTLVLRSRQLDELRAEVRKQYAAFRYRRLGALAIWALLGGAAVLLGAFLARGFDPDEASDSATSAPLSPSPVKSSVAIEPSDAAEPSVAAAGPAPAVASPAKASASVSAPPKKKVATSKRTLSLDELPTR